MNETKNIEYKSEMTANFLKTVSAFSNYGSGSIIFGVMDDGTICGIENISEFCLNLENKINDSISPMPEFTIRPDKRNKTVELLVKKGMHQPYLYKGKAYKRSDTATIEIDNVELRRLVLEGSNINYEQLECNDTDLKFTILEDRMKKVLGITKLNEDVIRTLGLINDEKKYTNVASLFADKNKFYGIDIARFGDSISEILDRDTITNVSVLRQYDRAIDCYKRYYTYEKINGIERVEKALIPETAFRETVANALIHRRWDIDSHIRIEMYKDRIEVRSPGGLPNNITKEEYLRGGISNLRNPIQGSIFFRLHLIEMFGTGIRRIQDSYADSKVKPEFVVGDNSVVVILPIIEDRYIVSLDEKKIVEILEMGILLSSSEISEEIGFSKAKTIRLLNSLLEKKYIEVYGTGRGTKYGLSQ